MHVALCGKLAAALKFTFKMVRKNGEKEFSALPKQEEPAVEEEAPKEPAEEPTEAEEGEADKAVEEEAPAPRRRRR